MSSYLGSPSIMTLPQRSFLFCWLTVHGKPGVSGIGDKGVGSRIRWSVATLHCPAFVGCSLYDILRCWSTFDVQINYSPHIKVTDPTAPMAMVAANSGLPGTWSISSQTYNEACSRPHSPAVFPPPRPFYDASMVFHRPCMRLILVRVVEC